MLVINYLEDQTGLLSLVKFPSVLLLNQPYLEIFNYHLNPLISNQPLIIIFANLFRVAFGLNYFNILIIATLLLNLILSIKFFSKWKYAQSLFLIYVFSSYYNLHFWNHLELSNIWLYLLVIYSYVTRYKYSFFVLLCITLYSNYIGFNSLIYFSLLIIVDMIIYYLIEKKLDKRLILYGVLTLGLLGLILGFFFNHYKYNSYKDASSNFILQRSLEDFFYFSSRPWYFLLPSPKHAFYGEFSSDVLSKIENTGNFLADDYFPGEHGASFFGYFLLLTFFGVSGYIVFKGSSEQKIYLSKYWLINIGLFLLMMPPYFTISGLKIYTPGYLVYEFFPMFRTTVRMSVLILLNILIVLAMFFNDLYLKIGDNVRKKAYLTGFMFLLTGVTLFETFIPIKIQHLNNPPDVYSYMGDTYSGSNFIVYPYSRANEAVFWVDAHKSYLVNPRMYSKGDYDAELFTKSLNTTDGIKLLSNISGNDLPVEKIDYFVVFKNIPEEEKTLFLKSSSVLLLEKEFEDSYLFRILIN